MSIKEATSAECAILAYLISEANKDVARKFGLNAENCVKHPSFYTESWVHSDFARGERYFILEEGGAAIGCVAYERPRDDTAYLNRLSVLPAHRCRGAGHSLVQFIVELARSDSVRYISIGVIGEHTGLQAWYQQRGFTAGALKHFPHLPFSVRYMTYEVGAA